MIYIDDFFYPWHNMKMCHLIGTDEKELIEFGRKIGLKKEWLQRKTLLHFDICLSKRILAIKNGAKKIGFREVADLILKKRK